MEEKKSSEFKIVQFEQKVAEKKRKKNDIVEDFTHMSDDEIILNNKVDDMEHLLNIGESIVHEICEMEKKVGKKVITENLASFMASWDAMIDAFSDYYDNS